MRRVESAVADRAPDFGAWVAFMTLFVAWMSAATRFCIMSLCHDPRCGLSVFEDGYHEFDP